MFKEQKPLKLKLVVLISEKWMGPIDLKVYCHHKPEVLTSFMMDESLRFPPEMRTYYPRKVYWVEGKKFLNSSDTYGNQKVRSGDIIILTDNFNETILSLFAQTILDLKEVVDNSERIINKKELIIKGVIKGVLREIPWVGPILESIFFEELKK